MDYNYVENLIRENIKNKCPQLPNEIIEEYLDLTFFRASWITYNGNKDLYLVGIAESKYDFYYVGIDDNWKVIRNNIKFYFEKHPDEKLLHFENRVCSDEHLVFDNEEHTECHIEKV